MSSYLIFDATGQTQLFQVQVQESKSTELLLPAERNTLGEGAKILDVVSSGPGGIQ